MTARSSTLAANPLARAAASVPPSVAFGVSVAGRLLGSALVLWYAYDQYDAFDGRYFPRTWAYAVAVALLAVASLVPLGGRIGAVVPAAGAGVLVFAGAILAREPAGVGALIAGVVAWLAVAAWQHHRGRRSGSAVLGLSAGAALAFGIALLVAFAVNE